MSKYFVADGNKVIDTRDGTIAITGPCPEPIAALLNRAITAEEKLATTVDALKFYADTENWKHIPGYDRFGRLAFYHIPVADKDEGDRARDAITKVEAA